MDEVNILVAGMVFGATETMRRSRCFRQFKSFFKVSARLENILISNSIIPIKDFKRTIRRHNYETYDIPQFVITFV